jgi:hypothetical protein
MAFRIDDISVHLMPSPNKDEKEDRGRGRKKDDDSSNRDEQGQVCTMATATDYDFQKKECPGTKGGGVQALALLQAQLRSTLPPPPV